MILGHLTERRLLHLFWSHFLLFWLFLLMAVVMAGGWLGGRGTRDTTAVKKFVRQANLTDRIWQALFLLFLIFYVAVIFYKEDFAYYDNQQFIDFSVAGKALPPPIWPDLGRFFPLGHQEFNLLMFVTRSPAGYHLFAVAQLIVVLIALWITLEEFAIRYRVMISIAAMIAPSFLVCFTGLIYPERDMLFWLAILLVCLGGYAATRARGYFLGCLVATQFILYYKETSVIFVVAYALTGLLLDIHAKWRAGNPSWRKIVSDNYLPLAMLALSAVYAVLFVAALVPNRTFSYVAEHARGLGPVLLAYLETDWLLPVLLGIVILRFGRLLLSGGDIDPMWDSLAVGSLAYFVCLLALRLYSSHYVAPVNLIAILYLARISREWLLKPTQLRVSIMAILVVCVLIHDAAYSTFRVVQRKGVIATNVALAGFLKARVLATKASVIEVYFPYTEGYRLMELSAYLHYKGLRLAGHGSGGPETGPALVIAGGQDFSGAECVGYASYACIHAEGAKHGDLIVVLADDAVPLGAVDAIREHSVSLLSVNACRACSRPGSWLRLLHTIYPRFWERPLPEHWLQLDVLEEIR